AAGRDLRPVGHRRALELAETEETAHEYLEPAPDLRQVIGPSTLFREAGGPVAAGGVLPGHERQESDLRGPEAVAQRIEEIEILELVGADLRLGALGPLAVLDRNQLGR